MALAVAVLIVLFWAAKFLLTQSGKAAGYALRGGAPKFYGDYKYHTRVKNLKSPEFREAMAVLNENSLNTAAKAEELREEGREDEIKYDAEAAKTEYNAEVARLLAKYEQ